MGIERYVVRLIAVVPRRFAMVESAGIGYESFVNRSVIVHVESSAVDHDYAALCHINLVC